MTDNDEETTVGWWFRSGRELDNISADGGAPGPPLRKGGDGDGDGARVTVVGADSSLSEAIAALQGEVDTLEGEIKEGDAEMKAKGRDFEQRAASLKPKEDRLTELEKQKRIVMEQQQLQIQAGAPAQGMCLVSFRV